MATREELYRKFGPMLIEALALVIKDEINVLRVAVGKSERTKQQIMDAVSNKLDNIEKYSWMEFCSNKG